MTVVDLVSDILARVGQAVHRAVEPMTPESLLWRPDPAANSVAWLVWHLTRVQDSHVAGLAGTPQVWLGQGWVDRFGLDLDRDPVTRAIDDERRSRFEQERGHYESRHAIILSWRPPERRRAGLARYIYSDTESRSASYADTAIESFRTSVREVEQYLASVLSIRRMETREVEERDGTRTARYDELFQFIRFCITGENHPIRLPDIPMYLDWLATAELQHGLSPMVENRFLGVVAIDGFPAESWPGILNSLDLMPLTS